jgi:hypothetical protein
MTAAVTRIKDNDVLAIITIVAINSMLLVANYDYYYYAQGQMQEQEQEPMNNTVLREDYVSAYFERHNYNITKYHFF